MRKLEYSSSLIERGIIYLGNQQNHIFWKPATIMKVILTQEVSYSFDSIHKPYPNILHWLNASLIFANEQTHKRSSVINWESKSWNAEIIVFNLAVAIFTSGFDLRRKGKNIYILIHFLGAAVISRCLGWQNSSNYTSSFKKSVQQQQQKRHRWIFTCQTSGKWPVLHWTVIDFYNIYN